MCQKLLFIFNIRQRKPTKHKMQFSNYLIKIYWKPVSPLWKVTVFIVRWFFSMNCPFKVSPQHLSWRDVQSLGFWVIVRLHKPLVLSFRLWTVSEYSPGRFSDREKGSWLNQLWQIFQVLWKQSRPKLSHYHPHVSLLVVSCSSGGMQY